MLDSVDTSSTFFQSLATLITGGAFVGWYRERRKAKKDANDFAIEMIKSLSARVDGLVTEVAELKAQNSQAAEGMNILKKENAELKAENQRLRTALGEQNRRGDATQASLDWHERQGEQAPHDG